MPCPAYPVHNYTLVVGDSGGNRTAHTSPASGDTVHLVVEGLLENTSYWYYVVATNQFGSSNHSTPVQMGECGCMHACTVY